MSTQQTPPPVTKDLARWVPYISLDQIPEDIRTRAKYLMLDGIGCALVGAHLPWSTKAAETLFSISPSGSASVIGWNRNLPPLDAALINSTFIQGFELDDWHREAPLHSNSLLLPTLFSAIQHQKSTTGQAVNGKELLLSMLIGYEIGPRIGKALYGDHILSCGWHSGTVFGPTACAAAAGRLYNLSPDQLEDAIGIACTQACGLMSAQFGSDAKRMQHGFAARNALLGVFLAQNGYTGIKDVLELSYGGFLKQFSAGNGKTPNFLPEEVTKDLGKFWQTSNVCLKPYSSMAGTHPTIDCVRKIQSKHDELKGPSAVRLISKIKIILNESALSHGGWKTTRPQTALGAQMSQAFVAATQIIHGSVLPAQFKHEMLENDDVWNLVDKTDCELNNEPATPFQRQIVEITLNDGHVIRDSVEGARGVAPRLENQEIVEKYDGLTCDIMDKSRADRIKELVLNLEDSTDVNELIDLLSGITKNPIE